MGAPSMLGAAAVAERDLLAVARAASGRPGATLGPWVAEPVRRLPGPPSTAGLHRVRGTVVGAAGTVPWSVVVKILQSYRHGADPLPAELAEAVAEDRTWLHQADL